jgi:hypothetical protein
MRTYRVTVGVEGGPSRVLRVPSKTDVQAGDAAMTQMTEGESILSIEETDDPYQEVDAPPPGTQTHPDQIT